MSQEGVHVVALNAREQFVLRMLLSNLMAGYVDKSISESCKMESDEAVDQKCSMAVTMFWRYVEFSELLCTESMLARGKPKVLSVEPIMMRYLVLAVNGYEPEHHMIPLRYVPYMRAVYDDLKIKIAESARHVYSRSEVEQARKE